MNRRLGVLLGLTLLALPAFSAITGTIMTGDGAPIAGARVSIVAYELPLTGRTRLLSENPERVPIATAQTDAKGAFSLESPKQPVVTLQVSATGYVPASRRVERDEEVGALVLAKGEARTGSITSGNGKPVAGATVVLAYGADAVVVVKTDEQGRYPALEPKRIRQISVVHPGYAIDEKTIEWRQSATDRDLNRTLSAGSKVSGRVVGPDGTTPVAGADVLLDGWPLARSGEDGTFTIAHAPSRWTTLSARKDALLGQVAFSKDAAQTLRLMRGATISGRVVDAASKVPVAGAVVNAGGMRVRDSVWLAAETDAKGAYSMVVPASSYMLTTTHPGYEAGDGESTVAAGQQVTRDFAVAQLARVSGVVIDEERRPVAAATISDQVGGDPFRGGGFRMRMAPGITVVSGPDGRFTKRVAVEQALTLRAAKRGFPNATSEQMKLAAGERKGGVVLTIPSGIAVTGKVTDGNGDALSGVAVTATEAEPGRGGMFTRTMIMADGGAEEDVVRTATDGTFSMRLKEGTYDFMFRREGFAPKTMRAQGVTPSAAPLETTLEPASEITGRVVRGGKGVENAVLNVFSPGMEASATTGPDGSFTLSGLAAGPVMVMLRKEDEFISERRSLTAPGRDVLVQLPGGGRITGRVVDKATNKPLTQFQAGISMSRGGGGFITMAPPQLRDFNSDDGSFTLENVPAGALTVVANAPGYASANLNVTVEEGKTLSDVELQLDAGVRLTGRVTGPNGSPLSEVRVSIQPSTGGAFAMRGVEPSSTTDANGEYTLEALQAGEEQVTFAHPKYVSTTKDVTLKGREARLDVQLSAGQRVTGVVVTESGAPVAEAYVEATTSGSNETARTNAAGAFELEGLTPGRYRFSARKPGIGEGVADDVEIGSGAPVRIVMSAGSTITGRVTGLTPQEYANTTVEARAGRSYASAAVDSSGAFRIDGAPSGTVQVSATVSSRDFTTRRSSGAQTVEVAPGGSQSVDIAFNNNVTVRGRVTRNGAPVPNGTVMFVPRPVSQSQGYASGPTDENGVYSVSGLQEGDYSVYVMDMQRYSPYGTTFTVRNSSTFDIDYRTGTLTGRVVDAADGEPVSGARVELRSKAPAELLRMTRSATTDNAGSFIVESVPAGTYVLSATGEGFGNSMTDLSVSESGMDGLELKLSRNAGVTLRVIDERNQQPLAASVTVYDMQGQLVYNAPLMFFGGGGTPTEVKLPLSPGRYTASVSAQLYAPRNVTIQSPGPQQVALTPGGTLNVRSKHSERRRIRLIDASGLPYGRTSNPLPSRDLLVGTTTIPYVAPGRYTIVLLGENDAVLDSVQVVVQEGGTTDAEI
jgi:large repetitive protein